MNERMRRRSNKYQAEEIHYHARVDQDKLPDDVRGQPMIAVIESVRELFDNLIRRSTEGLAPTDKIRFCIDAIGLDRPISTCMMPVSTFTVEKVMSAVLKVLQSKTKIKLDEGFLVTVITIINPVGAGRRKISNIELDRLEKKSVLKIPYDDEGLCCAKAIVYAIAHLENNQTAINSLRRTDRPALINRARELHAEAGVPLGPCTYSEIAMFEEHLNLQISVLSADNRNRVSLFF